MGGGRLKPPPTHSLVSEGSMNSFMFIHCFLPKQSKRSFSFTCNLPFKQSDMEMVIRCQLAKIRPSAVKNLKVAGPFRQKCTFFILLGFDDSNVLLKYFYVFIFCSGRASQQYIDIDNPTLVSDMASKIIKCTSNFWTD